jgi:hypothetical protein
LLQFLKLRAKEIERVWSLLPHLFARMRFLALGKLDESVVCLPTRTAIERPSFHTNKVFIKIKIGLKTAALGTLLPEFRKLSMNLDNSQEPVIVGISLALGRPGIGGFRRASYCSFVKAECSMVAFNLADCGGFRHFRLESF